MIFLYRVEIPNYIRKVQIAKPARTQYYKSTDTIPKKYNNQRYVMKSKFLFDSVTKERVVKRMTTGKPKEHAIRGQEIWRGMDYHLRSKIASELKKYMYDKIKDMPVINDDLIYPLSIRIDFYDNVEEGEDIDNMVYFYRKCTHDALCGNVSFDKVDAGKDKKGKAIHQMVPDRIAYPPKLIDDDKLHVQDIPTRFYPIQEGETPKMVIEIYSLKDEE
jgi:hypothetical protein